MLKNVTVGCVPPGKERIPEDGVFINTSPDFLVGCDCTDGCRDKWVKATVVLSGRSHSCVR